MIGTETVWDKLDCYFSGSCSAEEVEMVRQWSAADPTHSAILADAKRIWDEVGVIPDQFDATAAVRALRAARANGDQVDSVLHMPRRVSRQTSAVGSRWSWSVAKIAAAVLVLVAGGFAWQLVARQAGRATATADAPMREYATARGQRADLLLSDGTQVWLSVDTHLRVPANYGTRNRRVYLDGEAYFVVRHDSRRPFEVIVDGAVVEDLGTEFVIRAYRGDTGASVVVADGAVALRSSATETSSGVTLTRGQQGEIDQSGAVTVTPGADVDALVAWRSGHLVLKRVPLGRAIKELERWYNVTISLSDSSLTDISVTGSFGSLSVDEVFGILTRTLGVRYARQGNHVRLMSGEGQ